MSDTSDLFHLYSVDEARRTILRRSPVGDTKVTPTLAKGIERVFGESIGPEEAVRRILDDVRQRVKLPSLIGPKKSTAFT